MKKSLFTIVFSLCLFYASFSQIVINEILYNIPGTGEDEEYIELYNAGSSDVDMQGYYFSSGVTDSFDISVIVPAGGYFVIAGNDSAFLNSFGFMPDRQWSSGGLSNGGEGIIILDAAGQLVDSVVYDDVAPWSTSADGLGYALQLCDPATDNNNGANWGISSTQAGSNGQAPSNLLYGTPKAANICETATFPYYYISDINSVDANGVADSLNVTCELRGVAHCNNNRSTGGYDFPLANTGYSGSAFPSNSDGIRVFSFSDVSGYTFTAGDSLHVWGTVSQYNGLLQFSPDSIVLVSQGTAEPTPITLTVSQFNAAAETYENRYLLFENVYLADPTQWTGSGSGFNLDLTDGTDTMTMRIDNDVDLYNQTAPAGTFDVTGWGGQFDFSSPYTSGHQLLPCSASSILTSTEKIDAAQFTVYPNPASSVLTIESDRSIEFVEVYNSIGQLVDRVDANYNTSIQLDIRNFQNGLFSMTIYTENQEHTEQNLIQK